MRARRCVKWRVKPRPARYAMFLDGIGPGRLDDRPSRRCSKHVGWVERSETGLGHRSGQRCSFGVQGFNLGLPIQGCSLGLQSAGASAGRNHDQRRETHPAGAKGIRPKPGNLAVWMMGFADAIPILRLDRGVHLFLKGLL